MDTTPTKVSVAKGAAATVVDQKIICLNDQIVTASRIRENIAALYTKVYGQQVNQSKDDEKVYSLGLLGVLDAKIDTLQNIHKDIEEILETLNSAI